MEIRIGFISIGLTIIAIILAFYGYKNAIKQLKAASDSLKNQARQDRIHNLQNNHNLILDVLSKLTLRNKTLINIRKDYDAVIHKGIWRDDEGREVHLSFGGKSILTDKKLINKLLYNKMDIWLQQYYMCGARHYYQACCRVKSVTRKKDNHEQLDTHRIQEIDESDILDINNASFNLQSMIEDLNSLLPVWLQETPAHDTDDEYFSE